jgi:ribosome maturation factor RimP
MEAKALELRVRTLVEPAVERLGFDLVAVEWNGRVLRLSIDAPGGVDADDCGRVSEQVSPMIDAEDPIPSRYTLEVSSPGIDRPVQRRSDFERFKGYRVKLQLSEGPPRRRYTGVIGPVEGDELVLSVDGAAHRIPLDLVERAHLSLTLEEYQSLAEGT